MSIFGAMTTAIAGLSAQSTAFSNVGDNLANTQTVGYKSVDTTFDNYITVSTATINESGTVVARPQYNN
ncbi:MAG: flagellar basal body protein [Acetobacteraceae bacterium]|nr:flagellar basal body protein [Acetobacteraceae bacterium]